MRSRASHEGVLQQALINDEPVFQPKKARRYSDTPLVCDGCGGAASVSRAGGKDGHRMLCPECAGREDETRSAAGSLPSGHIAARADLPLKTAEELEAEGLRVASADYPEMGDILWQRPDLVEAKPVPKTMRLFMGSKTADTVSEPEVLKERVEDNEIKRSLEDKKNQPWWWRHILGPAVDRYNDALPDDRKVSDEPGHQLRNIDAESWCRFRARGECMFPKEVDTQGSAQAGYTVWTPYHRGECPWKTPQAQRNSCPVSEPGPHSGERVTFPDATISYSQGGQRSASVIPVQITPKQSGFVDVREKAKRIRASGGVHIIAVVENPPSVTAEVKGETALYTTTITMVPGTTQVALSSCSCPWETYRWARSEDYKDLEGRSCAHILALLYEMQAQRMFGGTIKEDDTTPEWRTSEPSLGAPRPYSNAALHPEAAQVHLATLGAHWATLQRDAIIDPSLDEQLISVSMAMFSIRNALTAGPITVRASLEDVPPFYAQVGGELMVIDGFDDDGRAWANGQMIPIRNILYPTYNPSIGLHASLKTAKGDEPEVKTDTKPVLHLLHDDDEEAVRRIKEYHSDIKATGMSAEDEAFGLEGVKEIAAHQGFSLNAHMQAAPSSGYMVSTTKNTEKVIDLSSLTADDIAEYRAEQANNLTAPNAYLGAWVYEGKVYLDVSRHESDLDQAIRLAKANDQLAIYDLATGNSIDTSGKTASLTEERSMPADDHTDDVLEADDGSFTHAGLIVKAVDSGRVLMTQRTPYFKDDKSAYGKWEFPGGGINGRGDNEDGDPENTLEAALREFTEETGLELPEGYRVETHQANGIYMGILISVPNEAWTTNASMLHLETMGIGWFDPDHVKGADWVRDVVSDKTDWDMVKDAAWYHGTDADLKPGDVVVPGSEIGKANFVYDDVPEHADKVWVTTKPGEEGAEFYGGHVYEVAPKTDPVVVQPEFDEWMTDRATVIRQVSRADVEAAAQALDAELHEPEPVLDEPGHEVTAMDEFAAEDLGRWHSPLPPVPDDGRWDAGDPMLVEQHQPQPRTFVPDEVVNEAPFVPGDPRLAHLMEDGPAEGDDDIAIAAQAMLQKLSLRTFTRGEQQALIEEGSDTMVGARNDDRLQISGTHYDLGDDDTFIDW